MPGVTHVLRYTIPISQSTRKAQVLVGGGSEEFRVGDAADACRQLYAESGFLSSFTQARQVPSAEPL